jgi:hypothetical protein
MSQEPPVVVEAEPSPEHAARPFWEDVCRGLGSRMQIVALDADKWTDLDSLARWVKEFRELLASQDKGKRLLLTTIVVLAWPEKANQLDFPQLERFREILLAGANLRMKRARYYQRDGSSFLENVRKDLGDTGLLAPADCRPTPKPREEPKPESAEEEEQYRQSLEFYGDPPFQWDPADLAALFEKRPAEKTKAGKRPPKTTPENRPRSRR